MPDTPPAHSGFSGRAEVIDSNGEQPPNSIYSPLSPGTNSHIVGLLKHRFPPGRTSLLGCPSPALLADPFPFSIWPVIPRPQPHPHCPFANCLFVAALCPTLASHLCQAASVRTPSPSSERDSMGDVLRHRAHTHKRLTPCWSSEAQEQPRARASECF